MSASDRQRVRVVRRAFQGYDGITRYWWIVEVNGEEVGPRCRHRWQAAMDAKVYRPSPWWARLWGAR